MKKHVFIFVLSLGFLGFLFFNHTPYVKAAPTIYWFNSGADSQWTTLTGNWWTDVAHTLQAGALPSGADIVETLGATGPNVDLDVWIQPAGIDATATGISFTSAATNGQSLNITGNVVFNNTSYNSFGTITGNATFNNSSFNYGTITGTAIFNNSSINYGTITGNATFNNSSWNSATASTTATFNDSSYNAGTVTGTATFGYASGGTITLSGVQVWGTFGGIVQGSDLVAIGTFIFNDSSYTNNTVNGNATFGYASNGTVTLSGSQQWGTFTGTIEGSDTIPITTFIFNGSSVNISTIIGDATFNDSSYNAGTVTGTATFGYASGGTITLSGNQVWGTVGTAKDSDNNTITDFIFNDSSYNIGIVPGNAFFFNSNFNQGTVSGNARFYDTSYNSSTGIVSGNAIFYDSSYNAAFAGVVSGNASFYDLSINFGAVAGEACFVRPDGHGDGGTVGTDIGLCVFLIPIVTTNSSTVLSSSSADLFGAITDSGGENSSERGFQYGLTTSYGATASQTGSFNRQIFDNTVTALACGTYHFRAYATNSAGTGYGADKTFTLSGCGGHGGSGKIIPPTVTHLPPIVNEIKCPYFVTYHKRGERSDAIKQIQTFLEKQNFNPGSIDGFYGQKTFDAIKAFQLKYFDEVLKPWNLPAPTGRWYESTRFKANKIFGCSEGSVILDNGVEVR